MFFIFSFLEVFNIPFIPGFLTICLDVGLFIICCVKHVVDSDKETCDFSSGNVVLYYFLEYCLPCVFSIFSLFGTLIIWMLNILDGSCNFLIFLSYFQSTLLFYFRRVRLVFQMLCYLKHFLGLLIFIFKSSV